MTCAICGMPVDRRVRYVAIVWSPEHQDHDGIHPEGAEELLLFHNGCAPHRESFKARIDY